MATVIKKISELEHLEELTSASNVIIEENGKAKRFSAASLGKVKTVNGVEPDENGNIEVEVGSGEQVSPDWNQNDPTQPDYVKNRTHWVEGSGATIEWDGNTEGLESAAAFTSLYKMSGATPTQAELTGGVLGAVDPDNNNEYIEVELTDEKFASVSDLECINCLFVGQFIVAYDTEISFMGTEYTLPSTGIWVMDIFRKLTYGSTTYHPLDEAFIPDTIARKSDIPEVNYPVTSVNGMTGDVVIEGGSSLPEVTTENNGQVLTVVEGAWAAGEASGGSGGGVTSWNDLEDKPFGEEGGLEAIIENESPEIQNDDGLIQCETLIIPLVAGEKYKVILDGMEYQFTATEAELYGDQFVYIGSEQMFNDINAGTNGDFFIASVWEDGQCVYTALVYYTDNTTITLSVYKDATVIHPLDEKFIPDSIAKVEDIPHVAEVEFFNQVGHSASGDTWLYTEDGRSWFDGPSEVNSDTTLIVVFDGVRYECEVYFYITANNEGTKSFVGNLKSLESNVFNGMVPSPTGYPLGEEYPFAICIAGYVNGGINVFLAEAASTVETHTIQILRYRPSAVIDDMCIPDTIARKSDISACSWNDLTDKPSPKVNGVITWDGSTSGRETFKRGSIDYYKVSDLPSSNLTFTRSENSNGSYLDSTNSLFTVTEGEGATAYGGNNFIVVYSENFTIGSSSWESVAPGVYFGRFTYNGNTSYTTSVTYKCPVPDATGETVTAAEFNALLAALREAGYLAT